MLDLKAIFDVAEAATNAQHGSRDSADDATPPPKVTDSGMPVAVSPDVPEQANPLFDDIQAAPAAGAKHAFRSRLSKPASGGDWPENVAALGDFVLLLSVDDLPAAPFDFGPAATVVDATKFLGWLQADVRRGPNGPRAMYGALQSDLRRLWQCVEVHRTTSEPKDG